jgi:hypothetical protein
MLRFTCLLELLPMVEGVLAANGYHLETHRPRGAGSSTARVMTRGLTTVALIDAPSHTMAAIGIWGMDQSSAVRLLESLPFEVRKHPASMTDYEQGG